MVRLAKYEYIADPRTRREKFLKRKDTLCKKMGELKTLCGSDVCGVIYGEGDAVPDVWPSNLEAYHVLQRLNNQPPMQVSRKMDQDKVLGKIIPRLNSSMENEKKKNRVAEMEELVARMDASDDGFLETCKLEDLKDAASFLDEKMRQVTERIENTASTSGGMGSESGSEDEI